MTSMCSLHLLRWLCARALACSESRKREGECKMLTRAGHHAVMSNEKLVGPDRQSPLLRLDIRASLLLYRNVGQRLPRSFYKLLENTGSGLLWLPLVPVVWATPGTPLAVRTCAANLFLGLLVDLAFVGTLKGIVRRARPVYNKAGDFLLVAAVDRFSFPSGHAARCPADGRMHTEAKSPKLAAPPYEAWHACRAAFLALYATAWLADSRPALAAGVALWAVLVAVSRCLMGRHFLGDILAGLLVGVMTTAVVTKVSAPGWCSRILDSCHGGAHDHG